jgi:hemerythrin-like domain-containing protein
VVQRHAVSIALDQAIVDPPDSRPAENAPMSQAARVPLPGVHAPDAGFESPFGMLGACHERVLRSLALLRRLVDHLGTQGCDEQARAAAHDVWRYFEIAAPAHHADEELHVLPRLRHSGEPKLVEAAEQIRADHRQLEVLWERLGPRLLALSESTGAWDRSMLEPLGELADAFIAIHDRHVPLEDEVAFPAASARIDASELRGIGLEMAARRRR